MIPKGLHSGGLVALVGFMLIVTWVSFTYVRLFRTRHVQPSCPNRRLWVDVNISRHGVGAGIEHQGIADRGTSETC